MAIDESEEERDRYDLLCDLSQTPDVTEEELVEFEQLQAKHPDWSPPEAAPEPEFTPIKRRLETFTQAELEQIARGQNCSLAAMKSRWIIFKGGSYYVIGLDGEYRSDITKGELAVSLPRDLARVPYTSSVDVEAVPDGWIQWKKRQGDVPVKKTVDELLGDYSTVARKIVSSMAIQHSYYDPETETFYERACPLRRDIKPRFHANIDKWLSLLGGEKLKDWIATATITSKVTCAIYLHSVKDAGKTMLATGLARLWGDAPTDLASANAAFNSAITNNPLIFADEEMPKDMTSGFVRKFVGSIKHSLRRKGLAETSFTGAFRVIIAANNANLLKFEEEEFSAEDADAIAARILYIKSDESVAEYLRSIGGDAGTEGWVDGDKIAQHALWLRDNRVVERGPRFLVQGKVADIHRRIVTNGSIRGLVVEWVCKAVLEKNWGAFQSSLGIQVGGGHVYVNTSFVKLTWERIIGDNRPPSLSKIGRALKPLAVIDVEIGNVEKRLPMGDGRADYYNIDPQHVYDASRSLQIATVERFKRIIDARRTYLNLVENEPDQAPPLPPGVLPTGLFENVKSKKFT